MEKDSQLNYTQMVWTCRRNVSLPSEFVPTPKGMWMLWSVGSGRWSWAYLMEGPKSQLKYQKACEIYIVLPASKWKVVHVWTLDRTLTWETQIILYTTRQWAVHNGPLTEWDTCGLESTAGKLFPHFFNLQRKIILERKFIPSKFEVIF